MSEIKKHFVELAPQNGGKTAGIYDMKKLRHYHPTYKNDLHKINDLDYFDTDVQKLCVVVHMQAYKSDFRE